MPRLPLIGIGVIAIALGSASRPAQADPPPIRCHEFEIPIAVPGTTQVFGNNDYGDVVGSYTFKYGPGDGDVHEYGFVRHPDGSFDTVNFPDSSITVAAGINNAGVVVGSWNEYPVAPTYHYYPHGFILGAGGYSSWDLPGSFFTEIFGINDAGTIVGQWSDHNPDEGPGVYRGYMRSASGVSILDWPDSNGQTEPWDVDSADRAVGWVSNGHGFLWASGQFTDQLDFQPPAGATIAYGINDAGRVVGFYLRPDLSQAGFIRSPDGEYKSFDCDGQSELTMYGINNLGSMVGRWLTFPGGNPYGHSFYTDPGIEILPRTTRLKPQRGDQPIEVHFAAPPDLESATLEIKDPDGKDVTVDPPPALETVTAPFRFRLVWNGPWTRNNPNTGQPERLPAGNYTVVVKGTRAGDGSALESEPYKKVSLVEVKKVEVAECGSIAGISCRGDGAVLGPNQGASGPMPGGGKAVFPDATQPGGGFRQSLLVKAELEPDLGSDAAKATVYFRLVDVDDPSASTAPIDNDGGATTSMDNRNDGTAAIEASKAASPDLGGAAVADLEVSTQQGNNYRVVASTSEPWLADVDGVVSSQTGEVTHKSGEAILDSSGAQGPQVSEMLTVWRRLHLELDRMDPGAAGATQQSLQYNGEWTSIGRTLLSLPPFAPGRVLEDQNASFIAPGGPDFDHGSANGWKGATVDPNAFGGMECQDAEVPPCYPVGRNGNKRLVVTGGNLNQEASTADHRYYVRDDVLDSMTHVPHEAYDISLLRRVLNEVYIDASADAPNATPLVPFWHNFPDKDSDLVRGDNLASDAYWNVPLLLAFEGPVRKDYDPTDEPRFRGDTSDNGPLEGKATPGLQPAAIVYTEAIRDFVKTGTGCKRPTVPLAEAWLNVATHEVLHTLSLGDEGTLAGGLMCASLNQNAGLPGRNRITDEQKAQLRSALHPETNPANNGSCPNPVCP